MCLWNISTTILGVSIWTSNVNLFPHTESRLSPTALFKHLHLDALWKLQIKCKRSPPLTPHHSHNPAQNTAGGRAEFKTLPLSISHAYGIGGGENWQLSITATEDYTPWKDKVERSKSFGLSCNDCKSVVGSNLDISTRLPPDD